jgi:hypothetical protein
MPRTPMILASQDSRGANSASLDLDLADSSLSDRATVAVSPTPFCFLSWLSVFILFVSCLVRPVIIGVDTILQKT